MKPTLHLSGIRGLRAAGVIARIAVVGLLVASCAGGPELMNPRPPTSIGPLQRNWLLQGDEAVQAVRDLHAGPFDPAESAWAGSYGQDDRIVIYAAQFDSPAGATTAVENMRAAISGGQTAFTPPTALSVSQQPGFRTTGMDRDHFFFARGNWIVWVQGIGRDFDPALNSIDWVKPA